LGFECGEKIEEKSRLGIRFKWMGSCKRKCFIWKYKIKGRNISKDNLSIFPFFISRT